MPNYGDGECAVCRDKLKDPIRGACGHKFCARCINWWTERSETCCMCRASFKSDRVKSAIVRIGRRTDDVEIKKIAAEEEERIRKRARKVRPSMAEDNHAVDKIISARGRGQNRIYTVQWSGQSSKYASEEYASNLKPSVPEVIKAWQRSQSAINSRRFREKNRDREQK